MRVAPFEVMLGGGGFVNFGACGLKTELGAEDGNGNSVRITQARKGNFELGFVYHEVRYPFDEDVLREPWDVEEVGISECATLDHLLDELGRSDGDMTPVNLAMPDLAEYMRVLAPILFGGPGTEDIILPMLTHTVPLIRAIGLRALGVSRAGDRFG